MANLKKTEGMENVERETKKRKYDKSHSPVWMKKEDVEKLQKIANEEGIPFEQAASKVIEYWNNHHRQAKRRPVCQDKDKGDPSPSEEDPDFHDSTVQEEDSNDTRDIGQFTKIMKPVDESEDIEVGLKEEGIEDHEDEDNQEEARLADSKSSGKGDTALCRADGDEERTAGALAHEDFETIKLYIKEESMADDYNEDNAHWMIHESEEQDPCQPSTSQSTRNTSEMSGDKSLDFNRDFSEDHSSPAKLGSQFMSQEIESRSEYNPLNMNQIDSFPGGLTEGKKIKDPANFVPEHGERDEDRNTENNRYKMPSLQDVITYSDPHGMSNSLSDSQRTAVREETFQCNVCHKSFSRFQHLLKHSRIHTGEKPFQCNVCNKKFTENSNLLRHMRSHTGEKRHQCDICSKRFGRFDILKKHLRIHTGEKPYQCDVCDKSFVEACALSRHMKVHTGEKPYQCDICSKRFTESKNLSGHRRIHIGEKPYQCNFCEKTFRENSTLSRHIKLHTGEKAYQCDFCSKKFCRFDTLSNHIRIHTG